MVMLLFMGWSEPNMNLIGLFKFPLDKLTLHNTKLWEFSKKAFNCSYDFINPFINCMELTLSVLLL